MYPIVVGEIAAQPKAVVHRQASQCLVRPVRATGAGSPVHGQVRVGSARLGLRRARLLAA